MKSRKTAIARLAVLAATTLVVAACGGGGGGDEPTTRRTMRRRSRRITDKSADQDTTVSVDFGVEDRESAAG